MTTQRLREEILKLVATDSILTNLPGHLYWKDRNGVILGCNKEQALALGLNDPNDVIGKTNLDFFDVKTAEKLTAIDKQVIEEGLEIETVEFGGENQCYLTRKTPLRDADGKIIGLVGTSMNITKQKKLEEQLAKKTAELEEALTELSEKKARLEAVVSELTANKVELEKALELRDNILRNVSHEIRAPLVGMTCLADTLLDAWDQVPEDEKLNDFKHIVKSQHRFQDYALDMLTVSKLKTGTEDFDFRPNDLAKLVRDVVNEYSQSRENISLEVVGSPSKLVNTVINCDSIRMMRVLRAVIGNAVRYSKPDMPIRVSVEVIKDGSKDDILGQSDLLQVSVTDQGLGVPEEEKYDIFKPFYESSRTRCFSGGTGLGLAVAREIIDGHGGKMLAQPNECGTTFVFTIPRNIMSKDQLSQGALKFLMEQWPGHLYMKDTNYTFRACNQEQAAWAGASSVQELIGKTNRELLGEEMGKKIDAIDKRVLEKGESIEVEEMAPDGQYYLSRKAPVKDVDGKVIGLLGNSVNITKLKTRELELKKKSEELEKKAEELLRENAELKKALETREKVLRD